MVEFTTNSKLSAQNVSISKHDLSLIGSMGFVYKACLDYILGKMLYGFEDSMVH